MSVDIRRHHDKDLSSAETFLSPFIPNIIEVRDNINTTDWEKSKQKAINQLNQESDLWRYLDEGRRYMVFKLQESGIVIKVLFANADDQSALSQHGSKRVKGQNKVYDLHKIQHEIIVNGMGDMVPDTIFFQGSINTPLSLQEIIDLTHWKQVDANNAYFMIQDEISMPTTILKALQDSRAETRLFLKSLEIFLDRYDHMRNTMGFVPEITSLGGGNAIVNNDGRIFLPDTNAITRTLTKDRSRTTSAYQKKHGARENIQDPDKVMLQIETLTRKLEKGHLSENPQG